MEGKNKPNNLEKFFQQALGEYEEDPGEAFWDRIAPNIPQKPIGTAFVYKRWMILFAFFGGVLLSSLVFYWQLNNQLFNTLETQIVEKNNQIEALQQQIIRFQALTESKETTITTLENRIKNSIVKKEEITQPNPVLSSKQIDSPKKAKSNTSPKAEKEPFIKLEVARETGVVATASTSDGSWLQPFLIPTSRNYSQLFEKDANLNSLERTRRLLFDNQLISNSFFAGERDDFASKTIAETTSEKIVNLALLPNKKDGKIIFDENPYELSLAEKIALFEKAKKPLDLKIDDDELTSFITGTLNPASGYKYNLDGFLPNGGAVAELTGITSSWNWSVYGGFETKSKWSVQVGLDFNSLTIVKESINNIRFKVEYKNDGQDVLDGDLFKLSISTEQPVKIIRLPIMGGYRFDLSKRFYVTPKLGVSAVWKIKDQTQLRQVSTFSERLSLQNSGIFLTTKTTTESLEANFRTEFGFRWRKRWYLVAEPRFKYSGKALFQYGNLALSDTPFHIMVGIRFNVD